MATITSSIIALLAAAPEAPEPQTVPAPAVALASSSFASPQSGPSFRSTRLESTELGILEPEPTEDPAEAAAPPSDQDPTTPPDGVIDHHGALPTVEMRNMAGMPIPTTRPTAFPQRPPVGLLGDLFRRRERLSARGGGPIPAASRWDFEFHGYLRAPLRIGHGKRPPEAMEGQNPGQDTSLRWFGTPENSLHLPLIPDDQYLSYQYTQHNARDWAELYLSMTNGIATGTVSIQGFNFTDANWKEEGTQFGIAQSYVTLTPKLPARWARLMWKVGIFDNRYGASGRYDAGELETYLFGRTHSMGEALRVDFLAKDFVITAEHGIGATRPDPANANNAKFTFLHHAHAGFTYRGQIEFNVHWLNAFTREEIRLGTAGPTNESGPVARRRYEDGKQHIIGPELRIDWGRAGYWYAGFAYMKVDEGRTISRAIETIHSLGVGQFTFGILDNYFQGAPSGEIYSVIGQHEHSVQKILKGSKWYGQGRDFIWKVYFMLNKVNVEERAGREEPGDGDFKSKVGFDLVGNILPYLGVGARFTHVAPDNDFPEQNFQVFSPRLIFRTNFITHETIELQYSRYFYASRVCPDDGMDANRQCVQPPTAAVPSEGFGSTTETQEMGNRAAPIVRDFAPDQNVFLLKVAMWW